jgi:PAS domain S-box-containing protein
MMAEDKHQNRDVLDLRRRGERLVQSLSSEWDVSHISADEVRNLVHELQVYQAQLEIQNQELRHAQLELEESRDRLADLYDFAPVGYFTLDTKGLILEANLTGAHLLGKERRYLVGRPFAAMAAPASQATFYSHIHRVFESHARQTVELELLVEGRGSIHVRMESYAVRTPEGEPEKCLSAVSDITELRRVEEEIIKTQQEVLSNMREGVVVCNEAGTVSFTNIGFEVMFGFDRKELLGQDLTNLAIISSAANGPSAPQILSSSIANGAWRGELHGVRKDGSLLDVYVRVMSLTLFGRTSLIFVWEDITGLKQAQTALHESERRFRAIFESAADLIFCKDRSLRYTHANPAFEQLLGEGIGSSIGLRFEDLFGEEGAQYEQDVDNRVLAGASIEKEYSRTINGSVRRFQEARVPLRDQDGSVIGLCGIARDITERRSMPVGATGLSPALATMESPRSPAMKAAVELALRAAQRDSVVMLQGESGVGKDYLARFIHEHSDRSGGPYFVINCASVPHELAESELFGHEGGAFTGAAARKRGLLELAEGGTLLLNEVGELSLGLQAKLLAFLGTRKFTRVGGEREISINARLITATNRDLEKEVAAGRFRQDLFYRLAVMIIQVPPLRERLEDIPELVKEITSDLAAELQLSDVPKIDPATIQAFKRYQWPGNIRELKNVLQRALILGEPAGSQVSGTQPTLGEGDHLVTMRFTPGRTLRDLTDEMTRSVCVEALKRCRGNKKETARLLGIARDSLYRYMKQYGIESEGPGEEKE